MIWSSPPMVASTARISGSPNAALRSAARSTAVASSRRVVGYSTGTSPVTSCSRRSACSCTAGADRRRGERRRQHGDPVAGRGLGGVQERRDHRLSQPVVVAGTRITPADRRRCAAQGVERAAYVVVGGAPVAHRDPHDRAVVPARARHPGGAVGEQRGRDGAGAVVVAEGQADLGEDHVVEHLDSPGSRRAPSANARAWAARRSTRSTDAGAAEAAQRRPGGEAASRAATARAPAPAGRRSPRSGTRRASPSTTRARRRSRTIARPQS